MDANLEPVVSRLSGEFGEILPPTLVAACVEQADPHREGGADPVAAEQVARDDLTALAAAATRGSMRRDG